jgi:hypothetical protein
MPRLGSKSSDHIRSNNTLKRSISPTNYKTNKPIEYTPTKENKNVPIPVQTQSQQPGFLSNVVHRKVEDIIIPFPNTSYIGYLYFKSQYIAI